MVKSRIIIITGERGIGKTIFCRKLIEDVVLNGFTVAGILSPARFERGVKVGIDITDLATKQRFCLAKRRKLVDPKSATPGWEFDQEKLEWGNTILDIDFNPDLLIVDELGPMELIHNKGWLNGICAINEGKYHGAIVVIRPELVTIGKKLWSQAEVLEIQSKKQAEVERVHLFEKWFNTLPKHDRHWNSL